MQTDILKIRTAMVDVLDSWRADAEPQDISDIYLPHAHIRALQPSTMVVQGMRGAGKSFWVEALSNGSIRQQMADQYPDLELQKITSCASIKWDQRNASQLPHKPTIGKWVEELGIAPSTIWGALLLGHTEIPPELNFPLPEKFDPWTARVLWAHENQERLFQALSWIDKDLASNGKQHLLLIDGLDRVASGFGQSRRLLRGLFELMLEFRRNKGLRIKAFIREDMTTREVRDFSDASKLLNESCDLSWPAEDLYHLVFKYISSRSTVFADWRKSVVSPERFGNLFESNSQAKSANEAQKILEALCGKALRSDGKNRVYTWLFNHLADGRSRVSPRTMFASFQSAAKESQEQFPDYQLHTIHPSAIHGGVRQASKERRTELDEDYPWVELALNPLKKRSVPIDWQVLPDYWRNRSHRTFDVILEQAAKNGWFLPWDTDETKPLRRESELRDVLIEIGVLVLRSGEVERIDLPDIYRLAYDVGRRGGIRRRG